MVEEGGMKWKMKGKKSLCDAVWFSVWGQIEAANFHGKEATS